MEYGEFGLKMAIFNKNWQFSYKKTNDIAEGTILWAVSDQDGSFKAKNSHFRRKNSNFDWRLAILIKILKGSFSYIVWLQNAASDVKKVIYDGKLVIFNEKWWFSMKTTILRVVMNFRLTYDQRSSSSCFAFATFSFNFFFISSSRSRSNDGSKSNCINGSFFAFSFQINLDITHIPFFYKNESIESFIKISFWWLT